MCSCLCGLSCSVVSDSFATPWIVACQAPLSMGFPRQEYWSELPFPTPGDLPNPGIEPASPASPSLSGRFFTMEPHGKPKYELKGTTLKGTVLLLLDAFLLVH